MNTTNSMTSTTPLDTFTLRTFKKSDWNCFGGAEPFADGSEPMISEGEQKGDEQAAFMVVDANGITLYFNDGEDALESRLSLEGTHKDFILAIARSIRKDATYGGDYILDIARL